MKYSLAITAVVCFSFAAYSFWQRLAVGRPVPLTVPILMLIFGVYFVVRVWSRQQAAKRRANRRDSLE